MRINDWDWDWGEGEGERERERENIIGMLLMNIVIFSYEPARKPLYYKI